MRPNRRHFAWRFAMVVPTLLLTGHMDSTFASAIQPPDALDVDSAEGSAMVIQLDPLQENLDRPIVTALALSSNDEWIAASGDDHAIRILDAKDGKLIKTLRGHTDWVQSLDFSKDGKYLVSCGNDRELRVWSAAQEWAGKKLVTADFALSIARFHPDSDRVFYAGFGPEVACWSIGQEKKSWSHTCECADHRAIDIAKKGDVIAWGGRDGKLNLFDLEDQHMLLDHKLHSNRIRSVRFSDDGSIVTSVGEDRRIFRYDLPTEKVIDEYRIPTGKLMSLTQLDCTTIAVGGSDNAIHIYGAMEHDELGYLLGHRGSVRVLCSSNDKLISSGYDTTIRIWDLDHVWRDLEAHPISKSNPPLEDPTSERSIR